MTAIDLAGAVWRKSSRSNGQAECVEVAFLNTGRVVMRDSKSQGNGPVLAFAAGEWDTFLGGAVDGEFERP